MDALDLIFRRLVLAARAAGALERPLTVGEILETFVPYAAARRDGPIPTHDDYLQAVTELIAGERALIFGDDLMQDDLKAELASPNPDLTVVKTYAQTKVRLSTEGVQRVLAGDTTIDLRPPTPFSPRPAQVAAAPASPAPSSPPSASAPPAPAPAPVARGANAAAEADGGEPTTSPGRSGALFEAFSPAVETVPDDSGCPYCAQPIPDGRTVRFCPSCGQDLRVRRCAGCSAEIESGWKFCITCGRSAR
ncbi:MAG: zinc ribbon domain-containing protein [Gemmatimonadales bacterium]|nr:zinc ribbon domain-containing protein [Gemmatimonadales bacterium]